MSSISQRAGKTDGGGSGAAAGAGIDGEETARTAGEGPPGNHAGDGEESGRTAGVWDEAEPGLAGSWVSRITCQRGKKGINRMIRAEFGKLGRKYITMGRELSPEDQENIVRGRLRENVIIGTDRGVLSAKQLGSDKRISMWQTKSQVGMVILQPPPMIKVDHEVPLIESKFKDEEEVEDDPADRRLSFRR